MAVRDAARTITKSADSTDPEPVLLSQSRRPELGRFLLQVDRQTKGSYQESEAAEVAGLAIKTGHPILQVVVYDTVECAAKAVELPKI